MVDNTNDKPNDGQVISDVVKEYPNMINITIYHNSYVLPRKGLVSAETKKLQKVTKKEDNLQRSIRRSRTTVKDIMLSNRFDLWCTWTFNKKYVDRYSLAACTRKMSTWLRNQHKHSPKLKYLIVCEQHEDGAYHFHGLLQNFNGRLKDSGKTTKHGQKIYNAVGYRSGFSEFVKIGERFDTNTFDEDYQRVASYISKYIKKDMPLVYGRKRFWTSQNLERPKVTVNGVMKYGLQKIIKNHKPTYINDYLEMQSHKKITPLRAGNQQQLF